MNAICLVVDRLHAGYLGAYGNSWIETPALDRLASQSVVFDQALVDSPQLERLYRSYWQGWHAMCPAPPESRPTLAALLRQSGVTTALLSDEPQVVRHPLAVDFDEVVEIDPPWQPQSAAEIHETHFAKCFVEIIDWLEAARGPFLLWCHLGGLGTTWDAPLRFRRAYQEQGDPPPPAVADVPDRILPANYDPDELLGYTQSYAGQVTMLDTCLGAMFDFLDSLPTGEETLLTLISARGFPLGEHRRVGPCDDALFGELVHVPWMVRLPDDTPAAARSHALVEPADLWATLLDWWGVDLMPHAGKKGVRNLLPERPEGCFAQKVPDTLFPSPTAASVMPIVRGGSDALHDRLCVLGSGPERAIRTPAWYLRATAEPELFAKPDDRCEVNDVASRCREVAECLQDALGQYELMLPTGRVSDLPPLSDVLRNGM